MGVRPVRTAQKQAIFDVEDLAAATKFQELVDKFGPAKALETLGTDPKFSAITVHDWIEHDIEHLTGLRRSTLYDYRSYAEEGHRRVARGLAAGVAVQR